MRGLVLMFQARNILFQDPSPKDVTNNQGCLLRTSFSRLKVNRSEKALLAQIYLRHCAPCPRQQKRLKF